jgi:hypothetical protein
LSANCPIAFSDARAWGEYEQAKKVGLGTLDMMNRAFWCGIESSIQSYEDDNLGVGDVTTLNVVFSLKTPRQMPGSVVIANTDLNPPAMPNSFVVFSDTDGFGILPSPLVNVNYRNTPGVISFDQL